MIRALVVDDERPAREKLRALLAREPEVEVAGQAGDGEEAVAAIRALAPDLVFLDVQMPRLDGFDVIEAIGPARMPPVVFVTAHDRHALRAFEVHAVDYLLKPFTRRRLQEVLPRARERLMARGGADWSGRLEQILGQAQAGRMRWIRAERGPNREVLLATDDIELIRSRRNYLELHARGQLYLRRGTLADLEERLDPGRFVRINRSEMVRLDWIRELQPWFHGDYRVILRDGAVLTWSRRYRARRGDLEA